MEKKNIFVFFSDKCKLSIDSKNSHREHLSLCHAHVQIFMLYFFEFMSLVPANRRSENRLKH